MTATIHLGDCRQIIATLDDNSIDSIVTDPPYELGFMGKKWDNSGIAYDLQLWTECLRVLKPGGHLLAFGGTRTYHRMASAIEDAGFEIRDSIHWLYGSGFPKSLDVSKAIDKQRDKEEEAAAEVAKWLCHQMEEHNVTRKDISDHFGSANIAQQWTTHWTHGAVKPRVPRWEQWQELRAWLNLPDDMDAEVWRLNGRKGQPGENWAKRKVVGSKTSGIANKDEGPRHTIGASQSVVVDITAPATDAAKQWAGWGTALKPAHEPIVVARKPLVGTVAANVQQHGTGALNIDGARVGDGQITINTYSGRHAFGDSQVGEKYQAKTVAGRWPANVITDGSIEAEWVRYFYVAKASKAERNAGLEHLDEVTKGRNFGNNGARPHTSPDYKYEATTRNTHPTVKPLALMRYLVRLVTPPGGTVLEPFAGSGTTLAAAILEGFDAIGCELTDDYLQIIEGRIAWAEEQMKPDPESLFNQ